MSNAALIALPLIGGYAYTSRFLYSKYKITRQDDTAKYFRYMFYAVFMFVCGVFLHCIFIGYFEDDYLNLVRFLDMPLETEDASGDSPNIKSLGPELFLDVTRHFNSSDATAIMILSLVFGVVLPHLLNFLIFTIDFILAFVIELYKTYLSKEDIVEFGYNSKPVIISPPINNLFLNRAIAKNDFEKLLKKSHDQILPILLTLECGKFYIGIVSDTPDPSVVRRNIKVFPLYSGYRDDDHKLKYTTDYTKIYTQIIVYKNVAIDFDVDVDEILEIERDEDGTLFTGINLDDGYLTALRELGIEEFYVEESDIKLINDFDVVIPVDQIVYSHLFVPDVSYMFPN